MSEEILKLENVTKWYESAPERKILDGLDLTVNAGERFAIIGPSGCGKSTLLNVMGTLDAPSEGAVIVGGTSVAGLDEKALAKVRSEKIGFIFQMHHLLPQCTALENVLVPTLAHPGSAAAAASERARDLLGRVGLADKADSQPSQLSGGERQRVAVVRALDVTYDVHYLGDVGGFAPLVDDGQIRTQTFRVGTRPLDPARVGRNDCQGI